MSLIIDPGHGGKDPGGGSNKYWLEKNYVLEVSLYQYHRLKEMGVPVKITRTRDVYLSPAERTNIVKRSGMKHCISNHVNAAGGAGDGAETIHSIYSKPRFAQIVAAEIVKAGQNLRRVFSRKGKSGDYYFMHRMTGAVETIIVEYGFADSKRDDVVQLKANQIAYAEAAVKGYCVYAGYKYSSPGKGQIKDSIKVGVSESLPDGIVKPSLHYNADVRSIQTYLNFWLKDDIDADGYYGPATEKAIEAFQKARGIDSDGIYGPNTKKELLEYHAEIIAKKKAAEKKEQEKIANGDLPYSVVKPSDKYNPAVEPIQRYLNIYLKDDIKVDGYYGSATEKGITEFQRYRDITADGIYGPETRAEFKKYEEEQKKAESEVVYKVQAGSYKDHSNAEKQITNLKSAGFDAFIKKEKK